MTRELDESLRGAFEARLAELKQEHRDLDAAILRLEETPLHDQLSLKRLKSASCCSRTRSPASSARSIPTSAPDRPLLATVRSLNDRAVAA